MLLHWDGTAWTRVAHPGAEGGASLVGVTATSAKHAWAVGYTGRGKVFILRWNGTAWARVPIPRLLAGSVLDKVAATSAGNAWAVGSTGGDKMLMLRWNGTAWRRVAGLGITGGLSGVSAVSARDAWAVGETVDDFLVGCAGPAVRRSIPGVGARRPAATKLRSIILHWNGTTWKPATSAGQLRGAVLTAVTATSAGNAWAVGGFNFLQQNAKVLVLHWNGRAWK